VDISDHTPADWSNSIDPADLDDQSMSSSGSNNPDPNATGAGGPNLLAGAGSNNPTPSPTTPWMPVKPTMGNIQQVGANEYSAWTGGKPLASWSGLDSSAKQVPVTPNQFRPVNISTAQKGHIYRQKGPDTKFKRTGNLPTLEHSVWTHFVDTGMDTIAYAPDPVDNTKMVNTVKEHGRFSAESIKRLIALQTAKYDTYDWTNDREATAYVLDVLEVELAKDLRDLIDPEDPFPLVWLRLMKMIRSTSIDRYEHLKVKIKTRKPHQYAGQDLAKMAADQRADCRELEIAGQYDHNCTLHLLEGFLD
jgi:hypothetical protein